MPATKRTLGLPLQALGFRDAFDSFVDNFGSEQSAQLAKAANLVLQKSRLFKRIVDRLNKEYVSAHRLELLGGASQFDPDDDGVLKKGTFSGRRALVFSELTPGNRFLRAGSYRTQTTAFPSGDFIFLKFPTGVVSSERQRGAAIAQLVAAIAHETVHAFNRATGVTTSGSSLSRAERVETFIKDEIITREKEKAILKELLSLKSGKKGVLEILEKDTKSKGLRSHIENHVGTMILSRPEVERDFVSGTQLTYLETFVIEDLLQQSIRAQGLDTQAIQESTKKVNNLKFIGSLDNMVQSGHPERLTMDKDTELLTTELPEFAVLLLVRRLIEEHWRESGTDDRESILQIHRNFFPAEIEYTALP